ncbi:MAG: iron ABC transporter permease [Microbacteriaceae bacterium]
MSSSSNSSVIERGLPPTRQAPPKYLSKLSASGVPYVRIAVWCAVAALIIAPLTAVIVLAIEGNLWSTLWSPDIIDATINSIVSAGLSAIFAIIIGTVLALLLDRTNMPGKGALKIFLLSPLLVPPFVGAIAWLGLFGPGGQVNQFWMQTFGSQLWNMYGGVGVIFLLTVHSYPLAYLIISAALRRVPGDLEQAAQISGASPWRAVTQITMPLIRTAQVSAFTLIAVSNLADFGIPSIIGTPARYNTLATVIYRYIQSGTIEQPLQVVSTIGALLLLLAIVGVLLEYRASGRSMGLDGPTTAQQTLDLSIWKYPVGLIAWLSGLAITVLPLFALTVQSFLAAPGIPLRWENLTMETMIRALTASTTQVGAMNSIFLAVSAAVICGFVGGIISVLLTRTLSRTNVPLRIIVMLPQAVPGLILAVGWLLLGPSLGLFNTVWLILCAYVMAFIALVVQTVNAPLRSIPTSLEEAARIAGAGSLRTLVTISWRMALPAILTGMMLVLLTSVRELTISVLLLAPGAQTLGVAIFNLQQAGDYNAASALSLVVVVVGLSGLGLAIRNNTNT